MLTRKQYELLRFINERLKEAGVPPSFDEMKDALDLRSKSGIHRLITALEERGFIRRLPNRARAIEVIKLPELSAGLEATTAGIRRARETEADILITTGGASVGDHDLVKQSLEAEGVRMAFWRIAMRPGKPMMHGRLGAMRVIGLPGNPVSSYVCAFLFLVPLIRALSGRKTIHHVRTTALLGRDLAANDQREDYLRARLEENDDGTLIATPVMQQDSSLLGNLAAARALLVRPPFAPAAIKGSECEILTLPE